ncbi:hypothetical protein MKX73_19315 [Solibacillus sp. FSL W7-1436]|uniref:hypothetical protein n=1 Tax=Solibacillus sp. FSL W7-1436 TaxID=2921705 RepID=UPI0030FAE310
MNKWNNYETLEHFKGKVWVSKSLATEKKGNVCVFFKDDFHVLAYISPNQLEKNDLSTVVKAIVEATGTSLMLEDKLSS